MSLKNSKTSNDCINYYLFDVMNMQKVIRDGKVAVIYSPGYGAGWYTWNTEHKELLFHPKLVAMIEQDRVDEINEQWILDNLGIAEVYVSNNLFLKICWLPIGTAFMVDEYDGSEHIETIESLQLIA